MLSVAEAVERLRGAARPPPPAESRALDAALYSVLAADVAAPLDVPPAANSAMDGYALRHADWRGADTPMPVSQRVAAGHAPAPLDPGTAARIFTGAEIPPGADTVVMQENCADLDGSVCIRSLPDPAANVRPRGQDIRSGQVVLEAGQRLRAQELGLLASLGLVEVPVFAPLRVAIVSNGDELVEPGRPAGPGQIYNSNRYLLSGLLRDWGFRAVDLGIVPDRQERIAEQLVAAAGAADAILCTGGVSVGEEDHVKRVVQSLGSIDFWRVAVRPGKPLAFGEVKGTPFLGLPGNPGSVWVTSLVFVRPFLFACQGCRSQDPAPLSRPARFARSGGSRQEYLRARNTADGVEIHPNQSSGVLLSACWGNGLAVLPPDRAIAEGDPVDFLPYALLR